MQLDEHNPLWLRDIFDRHPVSPFVSIHHESKFFVPSTSVLNKHSFFKSLYRDPINFLQLTVNKTKPALVSVHPHRTNAMHVCVQVCEVRTSSRGWTVAVTSGLSVRLWEGIAHGPSSDLLWSDQTRAEVTFDFYPTTCTENTLGVGTTCLWSITYPNRCFRL